MRCSNVIWKADGTYYGNSRKCQREATTEYDGKQFCTICAAAKKRGHARYEATQASRHSEHMEADRAARKLTAFDDLLKAAEAMSFHYGLIFHDTPCASLVSFTKQPCDCIFGKFRTAIWKAKEAAK